VFEGNHATLTIDDRTVGSSSGLGASCPLALRISDVADGSACPASREERSYQLSPTLDNQVLAVSWRVQVRICRDELCMNVLPTYCPTLRGFWAEFEVCSGTARQDGGLITSRKTYDFS
jgi:hypothetical protein